MLRVTVVGFQVNLDLPHPHHQEQFIMVGISNSAGKLAYKKKCQTVSLSNEIITTSPHVSVIDPRQLGRGAKGIHLLTLL